MKTSALTLLAATLLSATSVNAQAAGDLTINTPAAAVECQPAAIGYSGGTGPYFISVIPGGQASAAPLEQFPQQEAAGTYTWTVDIAAGTSVSLQLRDGSGAVAYSSPITIQAGTNSDCIGNSSGSASAAPSASGSGSASSSAASAASSGSASASSLNSSVSSRASSASRSSAAATGGSQSPSASGNSPAPSDSDSGALDGKKVGTVSLVGAAIAGVVALL